MGKTVEIVNHTENKQDELMEDLIAIITSFCSRLYQDVARRPALSYQGSGGMGIAINVDTS
ncbi:hypothetical protein [Okeania sp. KiyG1]|uniref:hypothetical protein n=1 Tax=Okeania sp. KiyG1 TaxID=2720165 RepID=UPI001922F6FF|nr:hypothetical protein [Okeania sp. KiyG1]GGA48707.1 hypothetical protein CYANOKiyG1_67800 [Okeania sp. KiyG1]